MWRKIKDKLYSFKYFNGWTVWHDDEIVGTPNGKVDIITNDEELKKFFERDMKPLIGGVQIEGITNCDWRNHCDIIIVDSSYSLWEIAEMRCYGKLLTLDESLCNIVEVITKSKLVSIVTGESQSY